MINIDWGDTDRLVEANAPKSSDKFLVDLGLLAGVRQRDSYMCGYLVFEAFLHMTPFTANEESLTVVRNCGLQASAEALREQVGSETLTSTQMRDLARNDREIWVTDSMLNYARERERAGDALARMVGEGMISVVTLTRENHAVMVVGVSDDKKELILWDPLSGYRKDEDMPNLRREPVGRDDYALVVAAKVNDVFGPRARQG